LKTVYTAIFGEYENLKEPLVVTPGWKYICFTDQPFKSKVWEIRKVRVDINPQLLARQYKILFYNFIDSFESIWVDGSFTININLDDWWDKHFQQEITCIKHPIRDCFYEEALICIKNRRGDPKKISIQAASYLGIVPEHNGLIQSGILMRQKTDIVCQLCIEWYKEIELHSLRDQLSFAKIAMNYTINYITWDYRCSPEFRFTGHSKK
jgi:hypothetical protein